MQWFHTHLTVCRTDDGGFFCVDTLGKLWLWKDDLARNADVQLAKQALIESLESWLELSGR